MVVNAAAKIGIPLPLQMQKNFGANPLFANEYNCLEAQGVDRRTLPYRSWFQPYSIYIVAFFVWILIFIIGYTVFLPGWWAVSDFLFSYLMIFVNIALFVFWKVFKKTKFRKSSEVDLITGLDVIEKHEQEIAEEADSSLNDNLFTRIMAWIF